jgi:hypothetical protein
MNEAAILTLARSRVKQTPYVAIVRFSAALPQMSCLLSQASCFQM